MTPHHAALAKAMADELSQPHGVSYTPFKHQGKVSHLKTLHFKSKEHADAYAKNKKVPKHYRGNTNSEGGIPFGRAPKGEK